MIEEAGFKLGPALSLLRETFHKLEVWLDTEGPLKQEWRNGDRYRICRGISLSYSTNSSSSYQGVRLIY